MFWISNINNMKCMTHEGELDEHCYKHQLMKARIEQFPYVCIVLIFIFFIVVHPHIKAWISGQFWVISGPSCDVGVDPCNVPSIISFSLEINFVYVSKSAAKRRVKMIVFLFCCVLSAFVLIV